MTRNRLLSSEEAGEMLLWALKHLAEEAAKPLPRLAVSKAEAAQILGVTGTDGVEQ